MTTAHAEPRRLISVQSVGLLFMGTILRRASRPRGRVRTEVTFRHHVSPIHSRSHTMRSCGECQMCCWIYCVPEMDKPGRSNCKHQCPNGCAIHEQPRPPICTDFVCCWAHYDWWPEELRPDKCHVVFTELDCDRDGKRLFTAGQINPYAHLRKDVAAWVDRLVRHGHFVLFTYEEAGESECIGCYDRKRYPACSTPLLVKRMRSLTAVKSQQVVDFYKKNDRNMK